MAETDRESWRVPFRLPALVALAVPATLLILLVAAGWFYRRDIAPATMVPPRTFPGPGIAATIHPGSADAETAAPPPRPDPAIARAKADVVRTGLAGWEGAR